MAWSGHFFGVQSWAVRPADSGADADGEGVEGLSWDIGP